MNELITWLQGSALVIIILYSIKGTLVLIIGGWLAKKVARRRSSHDSDES